MTVQVGGPSAVGEHTIPFVGHLNAEAHIGAHDTEFQTFHKDLGAPKHYKMSVY
jgi:hypothetical protein